MDKDKDQVVDFKVTASVLVASQKGFGSLEDVIRAMMELFRWVLMKGGKVASYPMALFPDFPDSRQRDSGPFEVCVPIEGETREEEDVAIRTLTGITVAFCRHYGNLKEVHKTYGLILKWIGENGFVPDGTSREIYLTSPLQDEEEDLVTEIQIPVKRQARSIH